MRNRYRQTGAFLLVTIVFLMAAGGAMLYAMANLSLVSSTTAMVAHNGNMALLAAQSGLKYCELLGGAGCPDVLPAVPGTARNFAGIPCVIEVSDGGCDLLPATPAAPVICTLTSRAYCPNATDPYRGASKLSIQRQKTKTQGGYALIPASRQVLPVP